MRPAADDAEPVQRRHAERAGEVPIRPAAGDALVEPAASSMQDAEQMTEGQSWYYRERRA